jgi:hypothetical protein
MADEKKNPFTAPAATTVKLPTVDTVAGPVTPPLFTKDQEQYIAQLVAQASMNAAMVVMNNMKTQTPKENTAYNRNAAPVVHEICDVCHQVKKACDGKHTLTVVYPQKYPEWAGFFPGVKINGVTYRSGNENHRINIPTISASTILNAVLAFEEAEKNIHIKRKARHDSGSIGGSGTGAKAANVSWS